MIIKGLRDIILKLLLLLSILVGFYYPGIAAAEITEIGKDIQGHWAQKTINEWIGKNYIGGYSDGTFRPDSAITRAEFVALVNRVFGYKKASSLSFTDVSSQDWFAQEIAKARFVGYINGYSDGSFQPNQQISRQETAAILTRILSLPDPGKNLCENFNDKEDIPAWSMFSINATVNNGYISGYPDGTFRPTNATTRAEAISILDRVAGSVYGQAGTYGALQNKTTLDGNVTISTREIVLKNTIINGNLYLTEGIGDGQVTLDNVTVMGTTKVSGGGVNSIVFLDSTLGQVLINVPGNEKVRLVAQGATTVGMVETRTDAKLEELNLTSSGSGFNEVTVTSLEGTERSGTIEVELLGNFVNLTLDVAAVVKGPGMIQTLQLNCNGAVVANEPLTVIVPNGLAVLINGQKVTKTTTYTGPSKKKRRNNDVVLSDIVIVTSERYTVSDGGTKNETITNVPYGTSKADFLAALTKGEANQTWDDTGIDDPVVSGNTLAVTAQDGITQVIYTVTVDPLIADFTCTAHTEETTDFCWAAATEATGLQIKISEDDGETWIDATHESISVDATTARVTGLQAATRYKFKLVVIGGLNAGDSNIVEVKTSTLVGVSWTSGTNPGMTRLGAGQGKTAGEGFNGINPWQDMKLCNVADDGTINASIGDSDFRRDNRNGQVVVQIPKFYYKHTYDEPSKTHEFWVADGPATGFKVHPCFNRGGQEKDYVLLGAYKASFGETKDGQIETLNSITGTLPAVNRTRAEYRTLAQNRGAGWGIVDVQTRNAVMLLYLVEYANTDSQAEIGQGISGLRFTTADLIIEAMENANTIIVAPATGDYYSIGQIIDVETTILARDICANREIVKIDKVIDINTSEPIKTIITVDGSPFTTVKTDTEQSFIHHVPQRSGGCDFLSGVSGRAIGEDGKVSINYRGLEDIYGNTWEFTDGININNTEKEPYLADSNYEDDKFTGNYSASGIILPDSGGFYKNFAYSEKADWLLMPSEVGGTEKEYIPDFFYQDWENQKDTILIAGGAWGESKTSQRGGIFRIATHYTSQDSTSCDGSSRILFIP